QPADPPRLVLASQSPRRAELLQRIGLTFAILPGDIDETYPPGEAPREHAERLAREKASAVAAGQPDAHVIGSDTIVVVDDRVLGKPADQTGAARMLQMLSGHEHIVMTGVAVAHGGRIVSDVEEVRVRFRPLSATECVE